MPFLASAPSRSCGSALGGPQPLAHSIPALVRRRRLLLQAPAAVRPAAVPALTPLVARRSTHRVRVATGARAPGVKDRLRPLLQAPSTKALNSVTHVEDIMTRGTLHTCRAEDTIDTALEKLVAFRISGLPVVDDANRVVGVVSDFDLLALDTLGRTNNNMFPATDETWKAFKEVKSMLSKAAGKRVSDVMSRAVFSVKPDTCLNDATSLLLTKKLRRLPVVDDDGKLVGLISRGNIVRAALAARQAAATNGASTAT